jgi:predicted ATPase/DNA-binding CsgD family transcriptional regulator
MTQLDRRCKTHRVGEDLAGFQSMVVTTIRHNLPAEPNRFIGRERDIDELRGFVGATRAVTLCGAGGIGKTRLALHVVAALADAFPDGAWLVELGDVRQPELVVPRVAGTLGVAEEAGRPLVDTLAEALRPRRLLIALDNCEHLVEACARLCKRLLAGVPGLCVVATSREPLRVPSETVWRVQPMSIPPATAAAHAPEELSSYEAIRLFVERAAAARPGFALTSQNAAVVSGLCRALDGVPLAIELAAARVRALSVEQISALLTDRFRLLAEGERTAPPRQRTLRATIDWSHTLLTRPEQVLLRRLSVFAGWTLEMAERVCTADPPQASEPGRLTTGDAEGSAATDADLLRSPDVLDLMTALVDKSLVVVEGEALGQTRYRMLDSIREYAAERLADSGETVVAQLRLRDYVLDYAGRAMAIGMAEIRAPWSDSVDTFRRGDVDKDNLQQVLTRCLEDGDAESGLRICTGVRPYWIARGLFTHGYEWSDSFLRLDAPDLPAELRGAALISRAQLGQPNDPAAAAADALAGLELCRRAGESAWTAAALNLLAEADLKAGRHEAAAARLDEALEVSRSISDGWNEGYALGTQARLVAEQARLREAQRLGEEALAVMQRIDQQWGVARTLAGLGALARLRGDPRGARRYYADALPILTEIDARPEMARCLAGIGRAALDEGEVELARWHLTESLRLSQSIGTRAGVAYGLDSLATLASSQGQHSLAVRLAAAASTLREAAGFAPFAGARLERYLAPARRQLGEPAVARLWTEGTLLSADEAVALALGPDPGLASAPPNSTGRAAGRMNGPPVAAVTPPSTLTAREHEIAALIARGMTNRAIADELFISPATVARHVANILAKLGFESRTQIAAWMASNDR